MDVTPPSQQHPSTSDDELAKVLAGIGADDSANHQPQAAAPAGLQFEETPIPGQQPAGAANVNDPAPAQAPLPAPEPTPAAPTVEPAAPALPATPDPAATFTMPALPSTGGSELDALKKSALEELRPLVGKLDLPPEDKFDTLLLIIRSTDDQTLLAPAHEAAKEIPDETKRAQALLDVIKEIDYFSQGHPQPAPQA